MAVLWSGRVCCFVRGAVRRAGFALAVIALPGCSELARPSDTMPPGTEPPYVSLAASYLQSTLKDRAAYDGFEISGLRWIHSFRGWNWVTCARFHDHGHLRFYTIFIQDNAVVDGRYAVETDACEAQSYTQFDLMTGVLGRPTAPVQPALY